MHYKSQNSHLQCQLPQLLREKTAVKPKQRFATWEIALLVNMMTSVLVWDNLAAILVPQVSASSVTQALLAHTPPLPTQVFWHVSALPGRVYMLLVDDTWWKYEHVPPPVRVGSYRESGPIASSRFFSTSFGQSYGHRHFYQTVTRGNNAPMGPTKYEFRSLIIKKQNFDGTSLWLEKFFIPAEQMKAPWSWVRR